MHKNLKLTQNKFISSVATLNLGSDPDDHLT